MYEYQMQIVKVVDGDTVDSIVDRRMSVSVKERFRLYGINAPETRGSKLTPEQRAAGKAATQHLKDLLSAGPVTGRTLKDRKGKYGRYLVELFVGDRNLNQQMIEDGHAVECFY